MMETGAVSDERTELRARLRVAEDQLRRLIVFDGGAELMPWVSAHRLHKDEPYIDCPFCHDQFVPASRLAEVEAALADLWHAAEEVRSFHGIETVEPEGYEDAMHGLARTIDVYRNQVRQGRARAALNPPKP